MMKDSYLKGIWNKHLLAISITENLFLLVDFAKSHLGSEVEQQLRWGNNFTAMLGCTHVNKAFTAVLKEEWKDWPQHGHVEYRESGN